MNKICLVIHSIGIGGMERVMHQLAVCFNQKNDLKIHLVLIGKNRKIIYSLPNSIEVHRPSFEFNITQKTSGTLRTMWFLRKTVKQIEPDVILSFGEYWNNLVLLSVIGLNYPVFISDRSKPGKDLGLLQNMLRKFLYPRAAGYVAQTAIAKRVCLSRGWNKNIRVIGNPVRKIQTNGKVTEENIVLSVGRLIKTKHFDQLIKIFAEIHNPNWKLVIVGGNSKKQNLFQKLTKLTHDLGVEDSVFLEGEQKKIDSYYNKSKIFAFTSSSEGYPNVILEALSAGLPVVSYDCVAGPSEMIDDGKNGFLVQLFDQRKFKERLKLLMNNEQLRDEMGVNAINSVKSQNIQVVADKFFSFISDKNEVNNQRQFHI